MVDTRQKYINYIRDIRDKDENYSKKLKTSKKIKTAKKYNNENGVITFEKEDLKNLFYYDNLKTDRLNFLDAIKYFKCSKMKKNKILKNFDLLRQNKENFYKILETYFSDLIYLQILMNLNLLVY